MKFDESEQLSFYLYFLAFMKHCKETFTGIPNAMTELNQKSENNSKGSKGKQLVRGIKELVCLFCKKIV